MPTIEEILAAEATLRAARVTVDQLEPGDRVVIHRPPPGDIICTISATGTVASTEILAPNRVYPPPDYEVLLDMDDGGTDRFKCSAQFSVLRATGRPTVEEVAAGLVERGYRATVAGLGGNIVGVEVITISGYHWVISADDAWYIGRDGFEVVPADGSPTVVHRERFVDDGPAASAELDTGVELLVAWADQIMGCDR